MTTATVTVATEHLRRAVRAASGVARRGAKQPVMQCVLLDSDGSVVSVVATDSLRLVVSELTARGAKGTFTALVDGDVLRSVDLGNADTVTLDVDATSVTVSTGLGSQTLRRAEGSFPRYEPYLERDESAHTMIVDRAAVVAAVEDQSDDQPLRLRFMRDALQVGELVRIRVAASYDGPPLNVVLNAVFLHEALSVSDESTVAIDAAGPRHPITVRFLDEAGPTSVIMPMVTGPQRRS